MDTEPVLLAGRGSGGPGQRPARRARVRLALRLAGGGLLIAAGAIHLDLYLTGYRSIPTVGGLFLFQVIAAFVLGLAVLASAARIVAAAGAGFSPARAGGARRGPGVPAARPAGPATTAPGALTAVRVGGVTVLADAKGRTLYW